MGDEPKVEFALGSEVSPGHFFKSSFARSFVSNCRDAKSLDYEFLDNGTIIEEGEVNGDARNNNNFFSLVNFTDSATNERTFNDNNSVRLWKTGEVKQSGVNTNELEKLRKQCQTLTEENRRLHSLLTSNPVPQVQAIDNVCLQTQVDTLQWQLKQTEANRQMYRSLMEQVLRFLERARKSLDILHEKNNSKDKSSTSRVPRSRSVHTVHADSSPSRGTSTCSSSSSGSAAHFTRAKSVTQISPSATSFREFSWSVLRRNDPVHCTPPRSKQQQQDLNKTHDGVVYRRPKQPELDPDDIPPEKLSQEAFRLMRTVQSLLMMREPDLARVSPNASPSPVDHHRHHQLDTSLHNGNFVKSTPLRDIPVYNGCCNNDRGNDTSSNESDSRSSFRKSLVAPEVDRNLQTLLSGVRTSLDATSLNSGSSKTTEEEDTVALHNSLNISISEHERMFASTRISTPNKHIEKAEKKDTGRCFKSTPAVSVSSAEDESGFSSMSSFLEVGPSGPQSNSTPNKRTKDMEKKEAERCLKSTVAVNNVSSVEDESGFSSMSSFLEVGLPRPLSISPVKGCHTEVGLPGVALEKVRHRRWSSTPGEIQALLKQHRASFTSSQATAGSLSVWV